MQEDQLFECFILQIILPNIISDSINEIVM